MFSLYRPENCFSKAKILVVQGGFVGEVGVHKARGGKVNLNLFFSLSGWDQSDKFVKIYISLNGVQKLPAENVQVNFTER